MSFPTLPAGDKRWRGGATAKRQKETWTVGGTIEAGDKWLTAIGAKTLTTSCTTTNSTTTASEILTTLQASTDPEFLEIDFTSSGAVITAWMKEEYAGKPFESTISTTESNDAAADAQTFTKATVQANEGPNDWSTAANWHDNVVPVSTDDVFLDTPIDILYGLAQSGVTLATLTIPPSFSTAKIGLPEHTGTYAEYRSTYLRISATAWNVQCASQRLKLDFGANVYTGIVNLTGAALNTGLEAMLILGTHASNVLTVNRGSVGVAVMGGEVSTIATLNQGYESSAANDSAVRLGSVVTLTTVNKLAGSLTLNAGATTVTNAAGALTIYAGAFTTLEVNGGTCVYRSTGTIGTLNVSNNAVVDFSQDARARTVTTCNKYDDSSTIRDSQQRSATWTNGINIKRGNSLANLFLGSNINLVVSTSA